MTSAASRRPSWWTCWEAHGRSLHRLARAEDDRPVSSERESKSVSVEDTFDRDITDAALLSALVERMSVRVADRLVRARLSGRTVTLKVRMHDFACCRGPRRCPRPPTTRASSPGSRRPVHGGRHLRRRPAAGRRCLRTGRLGPGGPVRLGRAAGTDGHSRTRRRGAVPRRWIPGMDVLHTVHGPGWVWGSGRGRVTVRSRPPTPRRARSVRSPPTTRPVPARR